MEMFSAAVALDIDACHSAVDAGSAHDACRRAGAESGCCELEEALRFSTVAEVEAVDGEGDGL